MYFDITDIISKSIFVNMATKRIFYFISDRVLQNMYLSSCSLQ